jgi:hypothetical protein
MQGGYRNLGYVLLAFPLIIVAGFWVPYFSQIPTFDASITAAVHIHALLLFAWVGLMVVQPLAIRSGGLAIHRILGKASYVLMPLIVLFSVAMLRKEYQENLAGGMTMTAAQSAEYLSTVQVTLFSVFYGLAIVRIQKRDIAGHMRYMICVALVLLPAGLARALGYWCGVRQAASQTVCLLLIDLCLILLIFYDRRRRFSARPYVVALAAYVIVEAAWLALGRPV